MLKLKNPTKEQLKHREESYRSWKKKSTEIKIKKAIEFLNKNGILVHYPHKGHSSTPIYNSTHL